MAYTLNENLKRWAEQYETAEFVKNDPVQIPRRYDSRVNIEISAFVTAWIAWGNRKQIIKKADFIDREIFHGAPYHYIVGTDTQGAAPEWRQYKDSPESFYRTFTFADFHDLCARLYDVYTSAESMEAAIKKTHETNGETALSTLQSLFGSVNGIPDFETQSACKRLCLFLRWMCRKGSPVDFGLWDVCEPRNLIIPLDTHVHKQAIRLGLVKRRTPDLQTAIEITDRFAEIFPDDPTKGDFALFGYGVNNGKVAPVTTEPEPEKEQPTAVADLSIADVLKMRLFYDNAAAEVREIWESRGKARKALKATERLKAHPIDGLHNAGLLEPGEFVVAFAKVLDKRETKLSRAERDVIHTIGMTAFNKTMKKLIADEKARNNSNGDNKQ
jgi:TIGR02757 family protein